MVGLNGLVSFAVACYSIIIPVPIVYGHVVPSPKSSAVSSPKPSHGAATAAFTRRGFGLQLRRAGAAAAFGCAYCDPALAKGGSDLSEDKDKLLKGLERLNYLLSNWEAETTVCGRNDNPYTGTKGCERTPLKVMDYMGYKSTNDPLFKADKTMRRLESLVPMEKESDYLEAIEKWAEAAEEASGMAYVSSWGEANPGGGKDRVEYFIERSKKNVMDARDSLATALDILKLSS
jgi:hypothetical protein